MRLPRLVTLLLSVAIAGCGLQPFPFFGREERLHTARSSADDFLSETFRLADSNRDGRLSPGELDLSAAQFQAVDADHDGTVSRAEWDRQASMSEIVRLLPLFNPLVQATRAHVDVDGNGSVSSSELRGVFGIRSSHACLRPSALHSALKASDRDGNGVLDPEEFTRFYVAMGSGSERAFMGFVKALLGAYLAVTSHIATPRAIHPTRVKLTATPADFGFPYEDASFRTEDGLRLKGWYIPAAVSTDKAILLLHGHKSNRQGLLNDGIVGMLHDRYNVLTFDMRNNGESEGTATSFGFHEGKDALAAIAYLKGRGNKKIAVYGGSMGGATAIRAAALSPDLRAVVEDCAFATVHSAFTGFIAMSFAPCPVLIAAATLANANKELGIDMTLTEPLTQVAKLAPRPFLVIHGAEDPVITVDNSRINYETAGTGLHKELWIVPKAGHGKSPVTEPVEYRRRLLALFERAL